MMILLCVGFSDFNAYPDLQPQTTHLFNVHHNLIQFALNTDKHKNKEIAYKRTCSGKKHIQWPNFIACADKITNQKVLYLFTITH